MHTRMLHVVLFAAFTALTPCCTPQHEAADGASHQSPAAVHGGDILGSGSPKYNATLSVYNRLRRAIGSPARAPDLQMREHGAPRPPEAAWFEPDRRIIFFDEDLYDVLATLGEHQADATAAILGHELAHFYLKHNWGSDFSDGDPRDPLPPKGITEAEAEADLFGGFYAYLAGYDVEGVSPQVLDLIYQKYHLTDAILRRYPRLAERKRIAVEAVDRVNQSIPVFEAANHLLSLGQWSKAARCFDQLAQEFPSREVLNNAAAARTYEALTLFRKSDFVNGYSYARFSYPLLADPQSRLRVMTFSIEDNDVPRREELLDESIQLLNRAISLDPSYAPALVNLACVYELRGRSDHAMPFASDAIEAARNSGEPIVQASAHIARGIIYAAKGDVGPAKEDFKAGASANPELANANAAIMEQDAATYAANEPTDRESNQSGIEKIDELLPDQMALNGNPPPTEYLVRYVADGKPAVFIQMRRLKSCEILAIGTKPERIIIVTTRPGYTGKTALGIQVGSTFEDVKTAYGEPARSLTWRIWKTYVYPRHKISFRVDDRGTVIGWAIFDSESIEFK